MVRSVIALLAWAVAAGSLAAQQPPPFDNYRLNIDSSLRTYTDPAIQAELKLTDDQKAKIANIPGELLAKHKDAIEKEKAAEKEQSDKLAAQQAEFQKKFEALVAKHLTADQRKRFGQLVVQGMGLSAFTDAEVTKRLSLPADAFDKLDKLTQTASEKLNKEFPNYGPGPGGLGSNPETRQKYAAAQEKITQEIIARFVETFTDEQKKAWKDLTGEPSEAAVPSGLRPFFGGGLRVSSFVAGRRPSFIATLLASHKVLAELKIEQPARDALAAGLKELREENQATNRGLVGGFGGPGVQANLRANATTSAAAVLTPAQMKRLGQILFQVRGTSGLLYPTSFRSPFGEAGVTLPTNPLAKLSLTPAQVAKIDTVLSTAVKKQQEVSRPRIPSPFGGFGRFVPPGAEQTEDQKARVEQIQKITAEYRQRIAEIDRAAVAEIVATFDAGQQAEWKELVGEPIDVTKLATAPTPFGPGGRLSGPGGFGTGGFGTGGRSARVTILDQWSAEASRRTSRGDYAAALATLEEATRLDSTSTSTLQQKANLLATCPSEWVRDGKQAVELMRKVLAAGDPATPAQYQILAAAYAEAGQFDEAVKTQQKAIDLLPKETPDNGDGRGRGGYSLRPQYEERLKLYQQKKPYRMPSQIRGPGRTGGFGPGGQ